MKTGAAWPPPFAFHCGDPVYEPTVDGDCTGTMTWA